MTIKHIIKGIDYILGYAIGKLEKRYPNLGLEEKLMLIQLLSAKRKLEAI